jgi:hypothetical protein
MKRPVLVPVVVLIVLWAQLTTTAYRYRVDDLSLPLLGRPSRQAPPADSYWVADAAEARNRISDNIDNLRLAGIKLFQLDKQLRPLDMAGSLTLITLAIGTAGAVVRVLRRKQRLQLCLAAGGVVYLSVWVISAAVLIPGNQDLNLAWRAHVKGRTTPAAARQAGIPEAARYCLQAIRLMEAGQDKEAIELLAKLPAGHYPNMNAAGIREILDSPFYQRRPIPPLAGDPGG